jgi:hypothetical protein
MTPLSNIQLAVEIRKEERVRDARERESRAAELLPQRKQIARTVAEKAFEGYVDFMAAGGAGICEYKIPISDPDITTLLMGSDGMDLLKHTIRRHKYYAPGMRIAAFKSSTDVIIQIYALRELCCAIC